jgi:tripartite-type tricarboxylate transporter receptor subunit TctC
MPSADRKMGTSMMNRRNIFVFGLALISARIMALGPTFAQSNYPQRPIRLVVPFPPGGVQDAVGRPWADKMKSLLGTIVIENIGGAGASLGTAAVARAEPDGYTLLLGNSSGLVINSIAASRITYDPMRDFEAISLLAVNGFAIVVNPSLPVRTLREFIEYAKSNPGKLSYGSAGVGSLNHLTGELFKSLVGTPDIVHVPYRGGGPAITDLISGHVPMVVPVVTGQVLELHQSGKLRMLAVTSPARLPAAPEIPTMAEAGLPGLVSQGFSGLFAPREHRRRLSSRFHMLRRPRWLTESSSRYLSRPVWSPTLVRVRIRRGVSSRRTLPGGHRSSKRSD